MTTDVPKPQTEPGTANAEEGLVILDGPDGIAVTMTADAAARTAQSLLDAAGAAEEQTKDGSESAPVGS